MHFWVVFWLSVLWRWEEGVELLTSFQGESEPCVFFSEDDLRVLDWQRMAVVEDGLPRCLLYRVSMLGCGGDVFAERPLGFESSVEYGAANPQR